MNRDTPTATLVSNPHQVPMEMKPYYYRAASSVVYKLQGNGTSNAIAMASDPLTAANIVEAMNYAHNNRPDW